LYVFAKLLWRVLPVNREPLPVDVQQTFRALCQVEKREQGQ